MKRIFPIIFLILLFILFLDSQKTSAISHVRSAIDQVSEQKLREYLTNLTDNEDIAGADQSQTRYSTYNGEGGRPRGNRTEAEYIKEKFDSFGIESSFQNFTVKGIETRNIIGKIRGSKENEVYILTSHMDSTAATSGTNNPAPGADDNGSGTAAVLEAARVIKGSGILPDYSLEFITFSGEEQGLVGSSYYVDHLAPGKVVKGIINLDMVGNGESSDCVKFYYWPNIGSDTLTSKALDVNTTYNIGLNMPIRSGTDGRSDHAPFGYAGYPTMFAYECSFSPVYHSVSDTIDRINFSQLTKTTKIVVGALVGLLGGSTPTSPPGTATPIAPPNTLTPTQVTTSTPTPTLAPPMDPRFDCYEDPKCTTAQKNLQLCPLICTPK